MRDDYLNDEIESADFVILVVIDNRQVISLQVMLSIIMYKHIIIATYKEIDIVMLQKAYGQVFNIRQYAMNNHRILDNCRLCCP